MTVRLLSHQVPSAKHMFRGVEIRFSSCVVIVALLIAACGGSSPTTTEPLLPIATTPTIASTQAPEESSTTSVVPEDGLSPIQREAVDRLVQQFAAGDADAIIATWDIPGDRVPLFEDGLRFDLALGGRWEDVSCGLSFSGEARCEFVYVDDLLEIVGAPLQDGAFRIGVRDDGMITAWFYTVGNPTTIQALVTPFRNWIDETYPELVDPMYNRGGFARVTPEAREIWVEKIAEYRQVTGAG